MDSDAEHDTYWRRAEAETTVKLLLATQTDAVQDSVTAKMACSSSVLNGMLYGLSMDRASRFGGYDKLTVWDLAREFREGSGDAGICFEWAVHEAIGRQDKYVWPVVSDVLEHHCSIKNGAESLLFGPEKAGRVPVLSSVAGALTSESRVYVGGVGQPPKLQAHLPKIMAAFRRQQDRDRLPASISGLWKADLFVGSTQSQRWVGTTVKIQGRDLEGAKGLRLGIYPRQNDKDVPRFDANLNLVRVPLDYDASFMEVFYKAFFLVRALLKADAKVPGPAFLPDSEDRFIAEQLEQRREFPVVDVITWLREIGQTTLVAEDSKDAPQDVDLSDGGLLAPEETDAPVSISPLPARTV